MNTKHQVISGIIGGIVGSIITALVVSSGTAQNDKFDTIQCRRLEVVDADGNARVILSTDVYDRFFDDNIRVSVVGSEHGGYFNTYTDGKVAAALCTNEDGGTVAAYGKDGKSFVLLGIDEHGGAVRAYGKDGAAQAALSSDEHGGAVRVHGKDGKVAVKLHTGKHGGHVNTYKDGKVAVRLYTNDHGGGVVAFGKDGQIAGGVQHQ